MPGKLSACRNMVAQQTTRPRKLTACPPDLLPVRHAQERTNAGVAQALLEGATAIHRRRPL